MFVATLRRSAAQAASAAAKGEQASAELNKKARRDPELYVLAAVMTGAFGLAGFYFGRKPTSASSEANIKVAHGSMPWQMESKEGEKHFKYQYHPGGDPKKAPKRAPSALHTTIIPNVTLPKRLHDQFNKWGKDEWQ